MTALDRTAPSSDNEPSIGRSVCVGRLAWSICGGNSESRSETGSGHCRRSPSFACCRCSRKARLSRTVTTVRMFATTAIFASESVRASMSSQPALSTIPFPRFGANGSTPPRKRLSSRFSTFAQELLLPWPDKRFSDFRFGRVPRAEFGFVSYRERGMLQ